MPEKIRFLGSNLSTEIEVIIFRDMISLYLLISHLRSMKKHDEEFGLNFREFTLDFCGRLSSFSNTPTFAAKGYGKRDLRFIHEIQRVWPTGDKSGIVEGTI